MRAVHPVRLYKWTIFLGLSLLLFMLATHSAEAEDSDHDGLPD